MLSASAKNSVKKRNQGGGNAYQQKKTAKM